MALTPSDKTQLIRYINGRTCEEFRQGKPCVDRKVDPVVELAKPHPGCRKAAKMIAIVERA